MAAPSVVCGGRHTVLPEEEFAEQDMDVWAHHTHKHMLHIAMETHLLRKEASGLGKGEMSSEECYSKIRESHAIQPLSKMA